MADSQRKTANLVDLPTWSNSITDTRVEFQLIIRLYKNGTTIGQNVFNITQTGYFSAYSIVASVDFDQILIKHNGKTRDITIIDMPFDGKKNQQIWFSATALGVNPTAVGGLSFKDIMLNLGDSALPYEPYGWLHSLRKLTTATEAVENPLYSDGTAITAYTIKGNTVQNGTPTPSNPVDVNGVGVRTENLWGDVSLTNVYIDGEGNSGTAANGDIFELKGLTVSPETLYTFSWSDVVLGSKNNIPYIRICFYTSNGGTFISRILVNPNNYLDKYVSFTIPNNCTYVDIRIDSETSTRGQHFVNLMFNTGSTAKPFEPYGYKIPILSADTTTPGYLGEVESTRRIRKLVLTGNEGWKNLPSDNTRFYLDVITPDYIRADSQITHMCTHYIPYEQTTSAMLVPNLNISMSSAPAQRLYITDSNYTSVDVFKAYLAQQYAAGTPVTVWYVLAEPETAAVNEPLMKIGDYADTLSNATAIPTTEGANSITVDTTVQPSEFTATWTGWHDATVKEWDGSQWD